MAVQKRFLDTHAVIWLYEKNLAAFSNQALIELENCELQISPIVNLELQYLLECGRITVSAKQIVNALEKEIFLKESDIQLSELVKEAQKISWTRDPFDRLIVAQSQINKTPLITKDKIIRKYCKKAVW